MLSKHILLEKLASLDGKDYGGYQSLRGEYDFSSYGLSIRQIPKDPYAPPHTGIYGIQVTRDAHGVINYPLTSKIQEIAFRDFLSRRFYVAGSEIAKGRRGTGFSGVITINPPSQAILDRNCVLVDEETIEVRCFLGLPADGRKINADIAQTMLFDELPKIVDRALYKATLRPEDLSRHIHAAVDADHLRNRLDALGLVAFVANGAILPRKSGTSDRSMARASAIPFISPKSMQVEIDLPHAGPIVGMGIPKGVTLIVGGGFHGKSTLLNTLELGCYNHVPGDGRELCVSMPQTVKIRAYSGRSVAGTDISPFIRNLPFRKNTTAFSTDNASGSTSQAAGIMEAFEMGAKVLLMDEDTCAANFMIRDAKMQQLVRREDEPITPFIDTVKQLYAQKQISSILVLGGVGDYFDVSDHVVQMIQYQPKDVTRQAHAIAKASPINVVAEEDKHSFRIRERILRPESITPRNAYGKKAIYAKEVHTLNFGRHTIDLTDLEQLTELSQTKAIGYALDYARKYMDGKSSLKEIIEKVLRDIEEQGLDILSDRISGHFAEFRPFELAFAMNRLRSLVVTQKNVGKRNSYS